MITCLKFLCLHGKCLKHTTYDCHFCGLWGSGADKRNLNLNWLSFTHPHLVNPDLPGFSNLKGNTNFWNYEDRKEDLGVKHADIKNIAPETYKAVSLTEARSYTIVMRWPVHHMLVIRSLHSPSSALHYDSNWLRDPQLWCSLRPLLYSITLTSNNYDQSQSYRGTQRGWLLEDFLSHNLIQVSMANFWVF